jgi:hypothetical protein
MEILIEPIPPSRYKGTLIIDGNVVETTLQSRPGCCARTLMNKLLLLRGKPKEPISLAIEGW